PLLARELPGGHRLVVRTHVDDAVRDRRIAVHGGSGRRRPRLRAGRGPERDDASVRRAHDEQVACDRRAGRDRRRLVPRPQHRQVACVQRRTMPSADPTNTTPFRYAGVVSAPPAEYDTVLAGLETLNPVRVLPVTAHTRPPPTVGDCDTVL